MIGKYWSFGQEPQRGLIFPCSLAGDVNTRSHVPTSPPVSRKTVSLLVSSGVDVPAKTNVDLAPLHLASGSCRTETVSYLTECTCQNPVALERYEIRLGLRIDDES
jgi:ankyrin repeat protein